MEAIAYLIIGFIAGIGGAGIGAILYRRAIRPKKKEPKKEFKQGYYTEDLDGNKIPIYEDDREI